jgi:xylulose-5-phosphate/fructose-6-phosphate phosphoketolase
MSRYHLCLDALKWSRRAVEGSDVLAAHCEEMLERHRQYVVEHLDDMPEVKDWTWSPA